MRAVLVVSTSRVSAEAFSGAVRDLREAGAEVGVISWFRPPRTLDGLAECATVGPFPEPCPAPAPQLPAGSEPLPPELPVDPPASYELLPVDAAAEDTDTAEPDLPLAQETLDEEGRDDPIVRPGTVAVLRRLTGRVRRRGRAALRWRWRRLRAAVLWRRRQLHRGVRRRIGRHRRQLRDRTSFVRRSTELHRLRYWRAVRRDVRAQSMAARADVLIAFDGPSLLGVWDLARRHPDVAALNGTAAGLRWVRRRASLTCRDGSSAGGSG